MSIFPISAPGANAGAILPDTLNDRIAHLVTITTPSRCGSPCDRLGIDPAGNRDDRPIAVSKVQYFTVGGAGIVARSTPARPLRGNDSTPRHFGSSIACSRSR